MIFIIFKHLNYPSSIINRNTNFFFINYIYNFWTFKLSFKYHKQKSNLPFFLIIFVILKHLTYPSSIINRNPTIVSLIIFIIFKHLNYHSSIINRNPTYFFFNYFCNFKTFKLSFKYHKQKSNYHFLIIFIILKHLNYHSSIKNRNTTYFFF